LRKLQIGGSQESEPVASRSDVLALAHVGRSLMLESPASFDSIINKANSSVISSLTEAWKLIQKKGYGLVLYFTTTSKISCTRVSLLIIIIFPLLLRKCHLLRIRLIAH
jgi:hypothetical protein